MEGEQDFFFLTVPGLIIFSFLFRNKIILLLQVNGNIILVEKNPSS